jgi:hypothetical protein
MKRIIVVTLALVLSIAGYAVPAQAAVWKSSITFNASPEPVAAGGQVTLAGKAGFTNAGNAGIVRFYFRRSTASTFTYIAATKTTATGAYSLKTRQSTSGHWKATYGGNSIRKPVTSIVDYVEARALRTVISTRFSRTGTGNYKSAVSTWYTDRSAKVSIRVTCAEATEYNFLSVYWTGHPTWSFDYARFDFTGTSRTGTSFIYPDEKTGYIEIATQDGCSWTVTVTQVVQAYVAV